MNQLRESRPELADDDTDTRVSTLAPTRRGDHAPPSTRDRGPVGNLVVGRETTLSGEIKSCGTLIIEGIVDGNLTDCQEIEIRESGSLTGSALSEAAEIGGRFDGDLVVRKRLWIRAGGRVSGTIRYGQIEIEAGGRITGDVSMRSLSDVPADAMGVAIAVAFGRATTAAVAETHSAGFAVPGRRGSHAIEITPEGRERIIDDENQAWLPTDWKTGRDS
jgi:cytoskeletal protein CcmA (bactofilin family)